MLRSLALALLSALLVVGLTPSDAHAHSGKQSYLYMSIYDGAVEGRVEMPAADLGQALGIDIPQNPRAARRAVREFTDPIIDYVTANVSLAGDSGPWQIDFAESLSILPTENGPYVVLRFTVDEAFDRAPTSFTADFRVIIESDPEKDALLIIEDDWAAATFDNGSEPLLGFSVGMTEQRVELGGRSTLDSMIAIRGIGTDAVRTGIDVMLIVVAVVVPAIFVPGARRTHVVPSLDVLRRLGTTLAALIGGHTVTMWIVGTGAWTPSGRLTAVIVAAGLVTMSLFGLASWWKPSLWRLSTTVVVCAGLLQGVGLGTTFQAQDLDRRRPLTSLVAFQVGVEVALLILVVLVATPLALLRRTRAAPVVAVGLGLVLVGYGISWIGEAAADSDWPIEEVANPLRVWPRNVIFVALAIAVAAAIRRLDARSGRLRPLDVEQPVDDLDGSRHGQEATVT